MSNLSRKTINKHSCLSYTEHWFFEICQHQENVYLVLETVYLVNKGRLYRILYLISLKTVIRTIPNTDVIYVI